MQEQLRLIVDLFENRMQELEEEYKKRHKESFDREKMNRYVNRKMKKEITFLGLVNIMPSLKILKDSESFKY